MPADTRLVARVLLLLTSFLLLAAPVRGQEGDPVDLILRKFDRALNAADRPTLESLFGPSVTPSLVQQLERDLLVPKAVHVAVRLRDRSPLEGAPPGDGFSLIVEF